MKRILTALAGLLLFIPIISLVFPANTVYAASDAQGFSSEYMLYLEENSDLSREVPDITVDIAAVVANDGAETQVTDFEGKNNAVKWLNGDGKLTWNFTVSKEGLYNIEIDYRALESSIKSMELGVLIDGKEPYDGLSNIELPRLWKDDGKLRVDGMGNEFSAEQIEILEWQNQRITDPEGLNANPFLFAFNIGEHTLTLVGVDSKMAISGIRLLAEEAPISYKDALAEWKAEGYKEHTGEQITVQGEAAVLKSQNSLIALSDNNSARITPSDPLISKVNYIGGSNWSGAGDTITWEIDIKESGLYKLGFHYQQSYLMNGNSYRVLRIDDEIPFAEAKMLKFAYCNSWKYYSFADENDEPYLFYLEKGKHTVSLSVTLGEFSDFARELQAVIYELGTIYRQITMITGESPDANRDYDLFSQIPNLEERLEEAVDILTRLEDDAKRITGKRSSTATSTVNGMTAVMKSMLDYKYQAQIYKSNFYDKYSALSAWLYELTSMPVDIDAFFFVAPEKKTEDYGAGFFESLWFGFKRFCASMVSDYNNVSGTGESDENISLWVNWGRDQVQVLNYLVQSDFTVKNNISVDIKLTNSTVVQALLSGNGPDLYLRLARTEPVNLAMRGALYDLTQFDDFNEVCERFMPTATVPYQFTGTDGHKGTYALPDSQTFSVMFYRTDILEELGLTVPQTWDEFLDASAVIMRNKMQVGLPYTQITDVNQVNSGLGALSIFPTLLMQHGGNLYSEDLSSIELTSPEAVKTFTMWTDFYNKHSYPKTYDFYNRFRIGLVPIAIQSYAQYTMLSGAAPEIKGLWDIAQIPGVLQEDGTINRSQAGAGSGCSILNVSENKEAAWEFLKWWTGDDIQYRYSQNLESILGMTGRNTPATVDALMRMPWENDHAEILMEQWESVSEMPEVPGGYYIPRVIDQAFWNVANNNKSVRSMLLEWDAVADNEIAEKRSQYGLN